MGRGFLIRRFAVQVCAGALELVSSDDRIQWRGDPSGSPLHLSGLNGIRQSSGLSLTMQFVDAKRPHLRKEGGSEPSNGSRAEERIGRRVEPVCVRAESLLGFAGVPALQGLPERAARLWGASDAQIALGGASFFDAADRRLYAGSVVRAETRLGQ